MYILAIETTGFFCSVAVIDEDDKIVHRSSDSRFNHLKELTPMIRELLEDNDISMKEIDAIATSTGPGSFTGLRIGAASAKGLGLALDLPLIHVPTLDAMALNIYSSNVLIVPIMDARRNQVYTGIYKNAGKLEVIRESMAISIDELLDILRETDREEKIERIVFLGDGVPVFREYIDENFEIAHDFAPANLNRQRASNIAMLGMEMFKEGKTMISDDMRPEYLRKSQAERERNVD